MGTNVFPSLPGQNWPVQRSPVFDTIVQTSISGKETRIAKQQFPRWKWEVGFSVLRSAAAFTEVQQLTGFFNGLLGMFDTFLYQDVIDNAVTAQLLGVGDGVTKTFQLVRNYGGFIEPVLAPNIVSHVFNNGVDSGGWTVSSWGSASPGVVTYAVAPAAGRSITATFSYYWPVRMLSDSIDINQMMVGLYENKKFTFISVKN